jgi:His-Xaa-Ser system protein HxsD
MEIEVTESALFIRGDVNIYTIDVLHKCFYWYGKDYIIDIDSCEGSTFKVKLCPKKAMIDYSDLISKVKQDLIDFKLRDIVTKETKEVRELIIAKAFAYYEIDETPEQDISDPVGFNPENI